jgi:hypothetical protein
MAKKKRAEQSSPKARHIAEKKASETAPKEPTPDPDFFQLGLVVSERVKIDDVAVLSLSVTRVENLGDAPMRVEFTTKAILFGTNEERNQLVIRPTLSAAVLRKSDDVTDTKPVVSIEATFAILYKCDNVGQLAAENLEAFAKTNGIFNVWPYWRELVMSMASRMKIAPIVVPVLRL